jgi:putative ABC transport system ATP-binding protein
LIVVAELARTYRVGSTEIPALRGLDLEVNSGEFLGVVGVSGSGKSTLLHLLGGLDSPDRGSIQVAGRDLLRMSPHERTLYRRQMVGFVFQSFYLVPNLTAEQNVRLAVTFQGTYGPERSRKVADALHRVGLSDRARHKPSQLSGGEQQRVSFARAMVHQPHILLADEPTGNLDHATAKRLLDLIDSIRQDAGMTVVMVTHDEDLVAPYCTQVIRLRDGRRIDGPKPNPASEPN